MRLSRIKLAGFKSFVDPTDLKLPSSLVGIVGPNGCGKSNTIDAVRWVMGESSARHLRGESMEDVIFTGSSARKPVAQASVELIFDNSDGSLGGEYASYGEISIRREVSREGQSRYVLNNVRCRRRDIRDIFLGTGLGPRSYAIIEQGMISRLIDARPEEMRVYLEEAAGISKYKERRRETENRIRHTRDNLDRLNDLREEVDKQLEKLKRQARTAERYQSLKAEERQKRGELLLLRRVALSAQRDRQSSQIAQREAELADVVSELRSAEAAIEQAREQLSDAAEGFSARQAAVYRIGSEVSRIEQSIEHTRETRRQQSRELDEVCTQLDEAERLRGEDRARIDSLAQALLTDEPGMQGLDERQQTLIGGVAEQERALLDCQQRRQAHRDARSEAAREAEIDGSRIESLTAGQRDAETQKQRLLDEQGALDLRPLDESIATAEPALQDAIAEESRLEASLAKVGTRVRELRERQRSLESQLGVGRAEQQQILGQLASLEALQQAALNPEESTAGDWLARQSLADAPRLGQVIDVEPGWEAAVELVLGDRLEAICVPSADVLARCLDDLPAARLALVQAATPTRAEHDPDSSSGVRSGTRHAGATASLSAAGDSSAGVRARALSDLMRAEASVSAWIDGVRGVESLADAIALQSSLETGESLVTRDGLWLGPDWLRVKAVDATDSVLLRERRIQTLGEERAALEHRLTETEQALGETAKRLLEHEQRRETLLHGYNDAVRLAAGIRAKLAADQREREQFRQRLDALSTDVERLATRHQTQAEALAAATERRRVALARLDRLTDEGAELEAEETRQREALTAARATLDRERDEAQRTALRVESLKSARSASEQNLARVESQIEQLVARREAINRALASEAADEDPLEKLAASLSGLLESRLAADNALAAARETHERIESRLRDHEQARQRHDSQASTLREAVQNERLASEEVRVRLATLDEQLQENAYDLEVLQASLPDEADAESWSAELERLEQSIARLGPINLAAIDEFAAEEERKRYLDEQHADVNEALATLERAIQKIDRETRQRFRDTYDQVDSKFRAFFPRLFGGGTASLELIGDDLLDAGVGVVAQPPGKRISNIQLLSGGEKALTAVALVFAFFELNPSPFCMLDEVDAPLDDANVGRFCELVKEMSERVQFIFITHNKVTMEMASQLMGVTMNEPGVSRLVTVDVQEAVELAGV